MSKAVMISIKPKWVELIASGRKTVEVRKTRPKIDVPFKCYIYCTKPSYEHEDFFVIDAGTERERDFYGGGKVVGEFVCGKIGDYVEGFSFNYENVCISLRVQACLTQKEVWDYSGGKDLYGWYISNLKIYDKPKELSEFYLVCNRAGCLGCNHYKFNGSTNRYRCVRNVTRPPQSYFYVEELGE